MTDQKIRIIVVDDDARLLGEQRLSVSGIADDLDVGVVDRIVADAISDAVHMAAHVVD